MIQLPTPSLIGVIHLPALPGSAGHHLPMEEIVARALTDAAALESAGFDAVIIENFGDMPFRAEAVLTSTIAAMTVVADQVRRATKMALGINVLRNDARAALGIAAAVGAKFIRVNVHTGVYATDQGIIEGRAAETLSYRKLLGARVAIFADVNVKHAAPLGQSDVVRGAKDTAYRGLADALVVTGKATGEGVDLDELRRVRSAVPDRRVFVGSGATVESIRNLVSEASGVIVGTDIKQGRETTAPVDPARARALVAAARS